MIVRAMRLHDDNLSHAAEALGLSRLGLRNKLERYQLSRRRRDQDPRDRSEAPSDDAG